MRLETTDKTLDALIKMFNTQTSNQQWDAAYGTSLVIEAHYRSTADAILNYVCAQLKIGVINRAMDAATVK
jgi:hypothetical protein